MRQLISKTLVGLSFLAMIAWSTAALAMVQIGQPAPNFSATTINGKKIDLRHYIGNGIAVIEWYDSMCPFVIKHYDSQNMQQLQREYTAKGVKWLRIYSTNPQSSRYVNREKAQQLMKQQQVPAQVDDILDPDGKIGRLYGAKVALYMVIIDHGKVVYEGAIDNRPSTKASDVVGADNYVRNALNELLAGKPVSQPRTKAYGCGVKYGPTS